MQRKEWNRLYREVRTPEIDENLFPRDQRAEIALEIAKAERKEARKRAAKKNDD